MSTPKDKAKRQVVEGFEWFLFLLNAVRGEAQKELKKTESIDTAIHFLDVAEALIDIISELFSQAGSIVMSIKSKEDRLDRHELNNIMIDDINKKIDKVVEVSLSGELFSGITEDCSCSNGMSGNHICHECGGLGYTTLSSDNYRQSKHQIAKAILRNTLTDMIVKEMKNPVIEEDPVTLDTKNLRKIAKKRGKR